MEFHERVRAGYLELARRWPERIRVVSTRGQAADVAADIWRIVDGVLHP